MRNGRWWQILWIGIALVCLVHFVQVVQQAVARPSHGFHSYYTAARLLVAGVPAVQYYDNDWFRAAARRVQPDADDLFIPNMPVTAYLLVPLAHLDYMTARLIWTVVGLMVFFVVTGLVLYTLDIPKAFWIPVLVGLLLFQPLYTQLAQGQAYLVLTGWLVMAWLGYRRNQPVVLGVALGLMFIFKSAGALFFVLLLVQRHWRSLAWAVGTVGLTVLVTLPRLGIDSWLAYGPAIRQFSAQPFTMSVDYQSLPSLLKRLFVADMQWNPQPLLELPAYGTLIPMVGVLIVVGLSTYVAWRGLDVDRAFAVFTTAGVIVSPFSGDYHYLFLLLPGAILATQLATVWRRALLLVAMGLIGSHFDLDMLLQMHPLLAYPKLVGAFIIWGLALSPGSKPQAARFTVR